MKHILYLTLFFIKFAVIDSKPVLAQWTQRNDLDGGFVYCFAISDGKLFGGVPYKGIYYSSDAGSRWKSVSQGLTNYEVYEIFVSGSDIMAGTLGGIFLSTNHGDSWVPMNNGLTSLRVRAITSFANFLFVGTEWGGVFRSENNAVSWTHLNKGLTSTDIYALITRGAFIFAGTRKGLFRSSDYGESWSLSNNVSDTSMVFKLATDGTNIFVLTNKNIFRSPNDGTNLYTMNEGLDVTDVQTIHVHNNKLYAGCRNNGIFLFDSATDSWKQLKDSFIPHHISALGSNGDTLFATTFLGDVFFTPDEGEKWVGAFTNLRTTGVFQLKFNGTILFVGTGRGFARSTNEGLSWTFQNSGITNRNIYTITLNDTDVFIGTLGGGIFRSSDLGSNWQEIGDGLTDSYILSIAVMGNMIFVGSIGKGIWRSLDYGKSWSPANTGLRDSIVRFVAVSDSVLIAATSRNGIYRSLDSGTTWNTVNNGLNDTTVNAMSIFGKTLFIATRNGGIFRSTDNGDNWNQLGFVDTIIYAYDAKDNIVMAIGMSNKVFLSTDGGDSWSDVSLGLSALISQTILIANNNVFVAGGDGIWQRSLSEMIVSIKENVNYFSKTPTLLQNFPNPFNSFTQIQYTIPQSGLKDSETFVSLKIFNLLGQEIATLVNEKQKPGCKSVAWHANNIASGIYFYRIVTGTFTETKKLLLLK
ncbi:MAG: T9SS type A sorting domain-containing protein [Bacteroidota bacterium]|nr:T9SS type A sorting domain-containing protein [Bacteroidota bacterium]